MTAITTVAELDALPEKSVLVDRDGDAWQKAEDGSGEDGRWIGALPDGTIHSPEILLTWKPFTVVHVPVCPRCNGSCIDPDSKPMYHPGAPGIADPAGWEPCECIQRKQAAAALHMTKCAHDGCTTAHALPPGSWWLCADHNKNLTTGGTR